MNCSDIFNPYKKNHNITFNIENNGFDIHNYTKQVNKMPHRLISYSFFEFLIALMPAPLLGAVMHYDGQLIPHLLACWAGAYFKFIYDIKIKKADRMTAALFAMASLSGGYIMGNAFNFYFSIIALEIQLATLFGFGVASVFVAQALINIISNLEKQSWNLTQAGIKKWIKNYLNIK